MAACSGVTSLTVALAGQSVTAPVAVPTVACFCTVCAPVPYITGCNTNITFEFWSDIREHVLVSVLSFPAPLPFLQLCPVQPGAQVHRPVTGSQRALFSHTHFIWHPWPKRPLRHAGQERKISQPSRLISHNQLHHIVCKHSKFPWQVRFHDSVVKWGFRSQWLFEMEMNLFFFVKICLRGFSGIKANDLGENCYSIL